MGPDWVRFWIEESYLLAFVGKEEKEERKEEGGGGQEGGGVKE